MEVESNAREESGVYPIVNIEDPALSGPAPADEENDPAPAYDESAPGAPPPRKGGGCPKCGGPVEESFTTIGIIACIFCPICGLIYCCLAKGKRCTKCGHSWQEMEVNDQMCGQSQNGASPPARTEQGQSKGNATGPTQPASQTQSQQPAYQPTPQSSQVVVYQSTPVMMVQPFLPHMLDFYPQRLTCPFCHADVLTSVTYECGTMAIIIGVVIAVFGGVLGCCLIPCCIDACKDCNHYCPNCKKFIGCRRRM